MTRTWPLPQADPGGITIHQLSDTHIRYQSWADAETDHMLRDVERGLVPLPDALVHTGDIIDGTHWAGSIGPLSGQDSYAKTWLTSIARGVPSLWVPGNHDLWDRPNRLRSEWESVYGRPGNSYVDLPGLRIVGFCPDFHTSPDEVWQLDANTLTWIDETCGSTSNPVLLCDHYPPAELGVSSTIQPANSFADLISSHSNIMGMLTGHLHLNMDSANSTVFLSIGNRSKFPVVSDVSSLFSSTLTDRNQSARVPTTSWFVIIYPGDRWEIRYRMHGKHLWSGPNGFRRTVMDLTTGSITHTM